MVLRSIFFALESSYASDCGARSCRNILQVLGSGRCSFYIISGIWLAIGVFVASDRNVGAKANRALLVCVQSERLISM